MNGAPPPGRGAVTPRSETQLPDCAGCVCYNGLSDCLECQIGIGQKHGFEVHIELNAAFELRQVRECVSRVVLWGQEREEYGSIVPFYL